MSHGQLRPMHEVLMCKLGENDVSRAKKKKKSRGQGRGEITTKIGQKGSVLQDKGV